MTAPVRIPFNRPHLTGRELDYMREAAERGHLSGNGVFTQRCQAWLEKAVGAPRVFLAQSATSALEMAALILGVGPGDEVIVPSYTFVSTASAFALRGATPVFVDISADTLCIDERLIEGAITPRTRGICVVHYAGVTCDMDAVRALAARRGLFVVEDDAQGVMARFNGRPLGSLGSLAAISFHETKNLIAGEGGALVVNDPALIARAEIAWEKGTNRAALFRGEIDKYTWVELGSSYLPSELTAAFLWAQLEHADELTAARVHVWNRYFAMFADAERRGLLRRPLVPPWSVHNAHLFYILLRGHDERARVIAALRERGIYAVFHYVPLHSSPAGRKYGRAATEMTVTDSVSERLLRLPMFVGLQEDEIRDVVEAVVAALERGG